MKMKFFLLAAVISGSHVKAQQDSTKKLDDVVVTATRFPIKQSLTGKVLTVINREELERNSGKSLAEVLNVQSGLVVNGSGNAMGTNQDVYMRGASAGKTLVLLDGIPVYDVSGISGAFDLNFISIDQVERVEILKGSQSTLYGSDAVAGVINIISRKGQNKKSGVNAEFAGGTYNTFKGAVGVNGTISKTNYNLQYSKTTSRGFSSAYDAAGINDFDKDGFNGDVFTGTVTQKISGHITAHLNARYSHYKTDADADQFTDDKDYSITSKNILLAAGIDYEIAKSTLHLNYSYNKTERNYLDDSTYVPQNAFSIYSDGKYHGKSHLLELYSNVGLGKHLDLLIGTEYRRQSSSQEYFSTGMFGPYHAPVLKDDSARVNQLAVYASVMAKETGGFNVELGGRYNHFNKYGNVFTFSFNPSYAINKKVKLFVNVASGFKAPSLYQVYSEFHNPHELEPEKSMSFEGGIQYKKENVNLRGVYFIRNVKDNIVFFSLGPPDYLSYYVNADEQKDKGFELEAAVDFGKVKLNANYTNLDGKITSRENNKDSSYFNLYRRPKQSINLNLGIPVCKRIYLNTAVQSVGRRVDVYGGSAVDMPAYFTWNVYATFAPVKNIKIYADLKNITDEKYFEVNGYNSRRFNFMAGILVKF